MRFFIHSTMPTVLITRPKADAETFATALAHYGLQAEFFPTIDILPLSNWALPDLKGYDGLGYDGLIYTSANAVRCFLSELLLRTPNLFAKLRALNHYAVGVKTHRALQEYGIDSALYSDKGNAEDLVELLKRFGIQGKRFLFLRGSRSLGIVPEAIKKYGGSCEELIVYETRDLSEETTRELPTLLLRDDVTWIAFFSPSAVQGFFKALPSHSLPLRQRLAAIGKTTKEAIEHFGFSVQAVPEVPTAEALAHTIAKLTSP